ncbi:MAG: hypothetical protein LBP93_04875 [Treponema sp.]|jgi:hypothetical protein|nr:hypothetical protein [Treponema sp.]
MGTPQGFTPAGDSGGSLSILFPPTQDGNLIHQLVIGNYDLQAYVPVPVTGAAPVKTVNRGDLDLGVVWKNGTGTDITAGLSAFAAGEVYRAEITLSAKNGWSFDPGLNFQYPPGSVASQPGAAGDPASRTLNVHYLAAEAGKVIDQFDLSPYIPAPVPGAPPLISFAGAQYTGTVSWTGNPDLFRGETVYTASVTLAAAPGWVFGASPVFSRSPGTAGSFSPSGDSGGALDIVFPKTPAAAVTTISTPIDLTSLVPAPVVGKTPASSLISPNLQFSGSISWTELGGNSMTSSVFRNGREYRATAVLTAAPGFAFPPDLSTADFTHSGADSLSSTGAAVEVRFLPTLPGTPVSSYNLADYVPLPEAGIMPVLDGSTGELAFSVTWSSYVSPLGWALVPAGEAFHCRQYRAEITLQAGQGYQFDLGTDFTYPDGGTVYVTANQDGTETRRVTVIYKELTGAFAEGAGSALERIKTAQARPEYTSAASPLLVDLSPGDETVEYSVDSLGLDGVILDTSSSPAHLRIDGRGRRLILAAAGGDPAITVENGVTLYLRDIVLTGTADNVDPLIAVKTGGTLVFEDGAVLTGNGKSSAVSVDGGGTLLMKGGKYPATAPAASARAAAACMLTPGRPSPCGAGR